MSNRLYDALKWLDLVGLPAIGALYFGLSRIWGFPCCEEVVGSVSVICAFLGALLGISSKTYSNLVKEAGNGNHDYIKLGTAYSAGRLSEHSDG